MGSILNPLEEEDESIDGLQNLKLMRILQGVDLFNLHGRYSELGDKFGEHGRVGLDGAPLIGVHPA